MTFSYNFDEDILEHQRLVDADNELELKRLLRKYGSLEGIEKNADIQDSMAYMMANQNGLAQKILTQETGNSLLSSQGTQYAKNDRTNHASDANLPANVKTVATVDYAKYGEGFSKNFIDEMLNDAEFYHIVNDYLIPNEGGYNNDKDDSGGETNMGISKNTYPNEDIKNLTRERANAIFYKNYYKWNGLNKLPYQIRGSVVDFGVVSNPLTAIKTTHRVLGIPEGNIIGTTTLDKFKSFTQKDYELFLNQYRTEMMKYFYKVVRKEPKKKKFLQGWLNRARDAHLAD